MFCCPCLTDSENAQKVKSLGRGIGVNPEIEYAGYLIRSVRFILPNRQINNAIEEITMNYSEGRWIYEGVPDEDSLKLRDKMDWAFFPQNSFCFSCIQPFWPTTLMECLIALVFPWVGCSLLIQCATYSCCLLASPLWSCCSALRFKPEWKADPKITRANLLCTTKSVSVKCPGYKYHQFLDTSSAPIPPPLAPEANSS
jgi:hypothetical protein